MKYLRFISIFISLLLTLPVSAQDASQASGNASADISRATGTIIGGASELVAAGSVLTVQAIEKVGDSVVLVLKGVSKATTVSIKTSAELAGKASLAVGSTIRILAESTGYVLVNSGKVIAFIPNEVGKSLVHHSKVKGNAQSK